MERWKTARVWPRVLVLMADGNVGRAADLGVFPVFGHPYAARGDVAVRPTLFQARPGDAGG